MLLIQEVNVPGSKSQREVCFVGLLKAIYTCHMYKILYCWHEG